MPNQRSVIEQGSASGTSGVRLSWPLIAKPVHKGGHYWAVYPLHPSGDGSTYAAITILHLEEHEARILAAAPDLLAVVQALLLGRDKIDGKLLVDENSPLIDEARNAVAKATGAT